MDTTERSDFVRSYSKVLTNAWSDEDFLRRLQSDPKNTLSEFGLDPGPNANVNIVTEVQGEGGLDEQVKLWDEGRSSGDYKLYVPSVPQIEGTELSEQELENVAGGDEYCCCCSPCCTCT
jgi:hypothetical protein